MGAHIRQLLSENGLVPPGCDTESGTLQVGTFQSRGHTLCLTYTAPDGTVYKLAYDCDADTLTSRDT